MQSQIESHLRVVEAMLPQVELLERMADRILSCFERGGRVLLLGNGGSAADAQHIAAELIGRFKRNRRPLPAIALTTDSSILTAVSNDIAFTEVFARQVQALAGNRDVVWALSVSGQSPNVIRALEAARERQATVIGFTGGRASPAAGGASPPAGGVNQMAGLCDLCFQADHTDSDRVQEAHQLAYHLICDRIERACAADEPSSVFEKPRRADRE